MVQKSRLTDAERRAIVNLLLRATVDGIVPHGAVYSIARQFDRHPTSIGRVWDRHLGSETAGVVGGDSSSRVKANSGRKQRNRDEISAKIRAVPIDQRTNQQRLAEASGVSQRLIGLVLREGRLNRVTDRIKPSLTEANRVARLQHVLSHLDENTLLFDPGTRG
jgi:transposase-like protein